jgi:hypothetical protein
MATDSITYITPEPVTPVTRNHAKRQRAEYMRRYRARRKAATSLMSDALTEEERLWEAFLETRRHCNDLRELLLMTRSDLEGFAQAIARLEKQCNKLMERSGYV